MQQQQLVQIGRYTNNAALQTVVSCQLVQWKKLLGSPSSQTITLSGERDIGSFVCIDSTAFPDTSTLTIKLPASSKIVGNTRPITLLFVDTNSVDISTTKTITLIIDGDDSVNDKICLNLIGILTSFQSNTPQSLPATAQMGLINGMKIAIRAAGGGSGSWFASGRIADVPQFGDTSEIVDAPTFTAGTYRLFGYATAMSGDGKTFAVGYSTDLVSAPSLVDVNSVIVFTRANATDDFLFSSGVILDVSNISLGLNYRFGGNLSLSTDGGFLVVGCDQFDHPNDSGKVFVYKKLSPTSWSSTPASLVSTSPATGEHYGDDVAISGDGTCVIVGSPRYFTGGTSRGAVYVYWQTDASANTWSAGFLITLASVTNDFFGVDVAISDDKKYLLAGSFGWDNGVAGNNYYGKITVVYNAVPGFATNVWTNSTVIDPISDFGLTYASTDYTGLRVTMSKDGLTLATSAVKRDTDGFADAGVIFVYQRTGLNAWGNPTMIKAPDQTNSNLFGVLLMLNSDGTILTVSAVGPTGRGGVYIFQKTNVGVNTWTAGSKFYMNGAVDGDFTLDPFFYRSGFLCVDDSGLNGVVGSFLHNSRVGTANIFRVDP